MRANLVAACPDADGQAALAYLHQHIRRAERLGLRVTLVSDKQLARDARYPGAIPPVAPEDAGAGLVYRAFTTHDHAGRLAHPWCHLSRRAVEEAMRRPRELNQLLEWLEDFLVDGHYARTGRQLRR